MWTDRPKIRNFYLVCTWHGNNSKKRPRLPSSSAIRNKSVETTETRMIYSFPCIRYRAAAPRNRYTCVRNGLFFFLLQELRQNNLTVGADMKTNLALLHRYTLVRIHVKIGDHYQAAKLLIQVAANISLFPARSYTPNTFDFHFRKISY